MSNKTSTPLTNEDLTGIIEALQAKFQKEQTTPIQDKKLVVPVALALVIILSLVTATWNVSKFYETAINGRLIEGARQRLSLRKDIDTLKADLIQAKKDLLGLTKVVESNSRDIEFLWPEEPTPTRRQRNK